MCKQTLVSIAAWMALLLPGGRGMLMAADEAPSKTAATFDALCDGKLKVLDLTHAINPRIPIWPGDKYQPFEMKTIATLERDGVLSKSFSMPEHLGTHIDAPNHFERNQ